MVYFTKCYYYRLSDFKVAISEFCKSPSVILLMIIPFVTSWDKISRMSQFFHIELDIPVFRPHPVLQTGEKLEVSIMSVSKAIEF